MTAPPLARLLIAGKTYDFRDKLIYIVGSCDSSDGCEIDVSLKGSSVDHKHAAFDFRGEIVKIHDLASQFGTYLGEKELDTLGFSNITETCPVKFGAVGGEFKLFNKSFTNQPSSCHDTSGDIISASPEKNNNSKSRFHRGPNSTQDSSLKTKEVTPKRKSLSQNDADQYKNDRKSFDIPSTQFLVPDPVPEAVPRTDDDDDEDDCFIPETQEFCNAAADDSEGFNISSQLVNENAHNPSQNLLADFQESMVIPRVVHSPINLNLNMSTDNEMSFLNKDRELSVTPDLDHEGNFITETSKEKNVSQGSNKENDTSLTQKFENPLANKSNASEIESTQKFRERIVQTQNALKPVETQDLEKTMAFEKRNSLVGTESTQEFRKRIVRTQHVLLDEEQNEEEDCETSLINTQAFKIRLSSTLVAPGSSKDLEDDEATQLNIIRPVLDAPDDLMTKDNAKCQPDEQPTQLNRAKKPSPVILAPDSDEEEDLVEGTEFPRNAILDSTDEEDDEVRELNERRKVTQKEPKRPQKTPISVFSQSPTQFMNTPLFGDFMIVPPKEILSKKEAKKTETSVPSFENIQNKSADQIEILEHRVISSVNENVQSDLKSKASSNKTDSTVQDKSMEANSSREEGVVQLPLEKSTESEPAEKTGGTVKPRRKLGPKSRTRSNRSSDSEDSSSENKNSTETNVPTRKPGPKSRTQVQNESKSEEEKAKRSSATLSRNSEHVEENIGQDSAEQRVRRRSARLSRNIEHGSHDSEDSNSENIAQRSNVNVSSKKNVPEQKKSSSNLSSTKLNNRQSRLNSQDSASTDSTIVLPRSPSRVNTLRQAGRSNSKDSTSTDSNISTRNSRSRGLSITDKSRTKSQDSNSTDSTIVISRPLRSRSNSRLSVDQRPLSDSQDSSSTGSIGSLKRSRRSISTNRQKEKSPKEANDAPQSKVTVRRRNRSAKQYEIYSSHGGVSAIQRGKLQDQRVSPKEKTHQTEPKSKNVEDDSEYQPSDEESSEEESTESPSVAPADLSGESKLPVKDDSEDKQTEEESSKEGTSTAKNTKAVERQSRRGRSAAQADQTGESKLVVKDDSENQQTEEESSKEGSADNKTKAAGRQLRKGRAVPPPDPSSESKVVVKDGSANQQMEEESSEEGRSASKQTKAVERQGRRDRSITPADPTSESNMVVKDDSGKQHLDEKSSEKGTSTAQKTQADGRITRRRRSVAPTDPKKESKVEVAKKQAATKNVRKTISDKSTNQAVSKVTNRRNTVSQVQKNLPNRKRKSSAEESDEGSSNKKMCKSVKIVFTGMAPNVVDEYNSSLSKLGVIIESDIKKCDVLVTPKVARTHKLLYAIAKGIPVLSLKYIEWITRYKTIPADTSQYVLRDVDNEKKYKFNMAYTIENAQTTPLFQNMVFYMTEDTFPDNNTLKDIITAAGGMVFKGKPQTKTDVSVILVSSEEDKSLWPPYKRHCTNLKIISGEGILSALMRYKICFNEFQIS